MISKILNNKRLWIFLAAVFSAYALIADFSICVGYIVGIYPVFSHNTLLSVYNTRNDTHDVGHALSYHKESCISLWVWFLVLLWHYRTVSICYS